METQSMISSQCSVINEEEHVDLDAVEEESWTDRDYVLARRAWDKWRRHQFTSLRDDLWGNAIFLKEANAISVELKKDVIFQFILLTDGLLSPLSSELLPSNTHQQQRPYKKTIVCVKVVDYKNGATHIWSLNKLRKRLEIMRKMYNQACEITEEYSENKKSETTDKLPWFKSMGSWHSRLTKHVRPQQINIRKFPSPNFNISCIHHNPGDLTPPCYSPTMGVSPSVSILSLPSVMSPQLSPTTENEKKLTIPVVKSCSMSDIDYESAIYNLLSHQDPFYDRTPWFTVIGRGFAYLSNLLVPAPRVHKMSIISEDGTRMGHLRIAVHPFTDENELDDCDMIKYNSRRSSATAHLQFPEKNKLGEELYEMEEVDARSDVRFIEGKGESSNESSICEPPTPSADNDVLNFIKMEKLNENYEDNTPEITNNISNFCKHLKLGSHLQFRVTILDAVGISTDYVDIFCQFNFLNRQGDSFSTEPLRNNGNTPLAFYHVQNFSVEVTESFLQYICNEPLVFEVFGHIGHHAHHDTTCKANNNLLMPKSSSAFSFSALSRPVPATSMESSNLLSANGIHTHATYDLLVWFEICELEPNGEYIPVTVEHGNDGFGDGCFLLHQGIQRRITMIISHESGAELEWREVREIVVGNIHGKSEQDDSLPDEDALRLCLLPAQYVHHPTHDRTFFRCEGAWDSSLHNSNLLNRVTPSGERVTLTVSANIELDNCCHSIVISRDLQVVVCQRDAKLSGSRSFKSLFTATLNHLDTNRVSGVYEVNLKYNDSGTSSPGMRRRRRRVVDTSATYVRGEENLSGWRPRGDSLILEHQQQLKKFQKIMQVEKTRHHLLLNDIIGSGKKDEVEEEDDIPDEYLSEDETVFSDEDIEENTTIEDIGGVFGSTLHSSAVEEYGECEQDDPNLSEIEPGEKLDEIKEAKEEEDCTIEDEEKQKQLASKCVRLLKHRIPSIFDFQEHQTEEVYLTNDSGVGDEYLNILSPSTSKHNVNPLAESTSFDSSSYGSRASTPDPHEKLWKLAQFIPAVSTVRVSPISTRSGYLNKFDSNSSFWTKRWVVVRRPYVFIYINQRDPTPRDIINLSFTSVQFALNHDGIVRHPYTFGVRTEHRAFLFQSLNESDLHGWLYAFDPLVAGSIRSKLSRNQISVN